MTSQSRRQSGSFARYLLRRRALLKGGAAALAGMALPSAFGRSASAAPAEPLHFVGWQYNPQIVAENVGIFKKLYDENVDYELVPGEYHAVAETKLIGGQHIDMMYSEEDHLVRWNKAGWIRDVDGLPGSTRSRRGMYEVNVRDLSLPNGKLGGLPYYTGFNSFVSNKKHLDAGQAAAAGDLGRAARPVPQAQEGQGRRVPYISAWQQTVGEPVVEPVLDLVLRGRQGLRRQEQPRLRRAVQEGPRDASQDLYEEGLVQPDVFTLDQEGVPTFATGQHTYMVRPRIRPEGVQRPEAVADRRRLPKRAHAGRHPLDLHLDRALSDGRQPDRCRPRLEPDAVLRRQGQGRPVPRDQALGARVRPRHAATRRSSTTPRSRPRSPSGRTSRSPPSSRRPRPRATSPRRCGSRNGTGT